MLMKKFVVGSFGCNCTILADETTKDAIVIDPGDDMDRVVPFIQEHGLQVRLALHTHAHLDHINGTRDLKEATQARIHLHPGDKFLYDNLEMQARMFGWTVRDPLPVDAWLEHEETLTAGVLKVQVLHTPGHTPGSVCFLIPGSGLLFSGDTLFQASIGRTDLWGGDSELIIESILSKLMPLDDKTRVIPGHGPDTTIGREKKSNPFIGGHQAR